MLEPRFRADDIFTRFLQKSGQNCPYYFCLSKCQTAISFLPLTDSAPVVELVDAANSKSAIREGVGVQVPPGAPFFKSQGTSFFEFYCLSDV